MSGKGVINTGKIISSTPGLKVCVKEGGTNATFRVIFSFHKRCLRVPKNSITFSFYIVIKYIKLLSFIQFHVIVWLMW